MASKSRAGSVALVLVASAAVIGGVALFMRWQQRNQLPPPQFYAGLRGMVNPYTGQYMSAQQVTEMEWL